MRWLRRGIAAALALLAIVLAIWFGGLGPRGPVPGGVLWGEPGGEPDDWSFTNGVGQIQVETRLLGLLPYSVTTWCIAHAGHLYVPSGDCERRWTRQLSTHPEVRLRIDGRLYAMRAVRESDPALAATLAPILLRKYFGIAVESAHWAPGESRGCIFRMDLRP